MGYKHEVYLMGEYVSRMISIYIYYNVHRAYEKVCTIELAYY